MRLFPFQFSAVTPCPVLNHLCYPVMLCFWGALHLATFLFVCYYYMGSFLLWEETNSIPYHVIPYHDQTSKSPKCVLFLEKNMNEVYSI